MRRNAINTIFRHGYLLYIWTISSSALIIDPLAIKVTEAAGTTVEGVITVTNDKTYPVRVAVRNGRQSARPVGVVNDVIADHVGMGAALDLDAVTLRCIQGVVNPVVLDQ